MKKSLIVLFVLLLSVSLVAQVRTGNVRGKVTDTEGTALPGVSVTISAPILAPMTSITGEGGIFRFPSLSPGNDYTISAELAGFKKQTKSGIIVSVGQEAEINLTMEVGKLEEEVTVTAVTPTIDTKKTSVGKNVTQDVLQSLPSARDPWVVMQMVPSILLDRENVGGNESGQQSGFVGKGDALGGANNVWAVDGMVITDPAAIGGSPGYWDFDSFEEMNVTTGGADVTVQTGGIALNMVTRRGGNKVSLGGRFYYTDEGFQSDNRTDALKAELAKDGMTTLNKTVYVRDYGFNLGGPIVKDKVWLWGSYGVQDIYNITVLNTLQKPTLTNYNAKLNLQLIPSNRFEAMWIAGAKVFKGRSASASNPQGLAQDSPFHFGSPIAKIQDEQMIGDNLLISLKWGYMNASFQLLSMMDLDRVNYRTYDQTAKLNTNSINYYITTRPMYDYNFFANYFNDTLFGVSHDIKLGVEYSTRRVTSDSGYSGNVYQDINYATTAPQLAATVSPTGELIPGTPGARQAIPGLKRINAWMDSNLDWGVDQLALFASDTVTFGRFNLLLGLRYDHQTPKINTSNYSWIATTNPVWTKNFAPDVIADLHVQFPDLIQPDVTPDYSWDVFSPRIGLTYDLFGNGKTLFKLNFSQYGDFMGTGSAAYLYVGEGIPYYLGQMGLARFWFEDSNGDKIVQKNELYWQYGDYVPYHVYDASGNFIGNFDAAYGIMWNGNRTGSPGATSALVDSDAGSSKVTEYLASFEHELLPDFALGLDFTYRYMNHFVWDRTYLPGSDPANPFSGGRDIAQSDYMIGGYIPDLAGQDMGAGVGKPFYVWNADVPYSPYYHHEPSNQYNTYWGIDFRFAKRLSDKWMLDGSFTYQDQKVHFNGSWVDPTNNWALDDQLYAPYIGGASGKISQYIFSHWIFKLEGLYQLPMGFDISFTFNARQGHIIPHYMWISDANLPNPYSQSNTSWLDVIGSEKLPTFYQLNMRLEKMIKIGDNGRIYLMADCFNVLNSALVNRREDHYIGDYYVDAGEFDPNALDHQLNEVLNPRIFRFGVRFQL